MNKKRMLWMALMGVMGAAMLPAQASFDYSGCQWGEDCPLNGMPYLDVNNDTRVNLMQLIGSQKGLALPRLPLPENITRSRSYHFGEMDDDYIHPQTSPETTAPDSADAQTPFDKIAASLGVDPSVIRAAVDGSEDEGRNISNNPGSVESFFVALLDDETLTPENRNHLAVWRVGIFTRGSEKVTPPVFDIEPGSRVEAFCNYLNGADAFYRGDYEQAHTLFSSAQKSDQPWVKETANYMLFRVALNESTVNASDRYGMFEIKNIDTKAAGQARDYVNAYLVAYPQGRYADSARGMLRRVNWYLSDWQQLAPLYEKALEQAPDAESLRSIISENDNVLQSKDMVWNDEPFISDMQAPLLTFTQTLRWLRESEGAPGKAYEVTKEKLDALKPIFATANTLPLWDYLHNSWLYVHEHDYAAVVAAIKPVQTLPTNDILLFSQQILLGDALVAQNLSPQVEAHWRHLLTLAQIPEQQQYLQLKLAAALVNSHKTETIFAADSPVTNLRYRSLVLKTIAQKPLLQQQVSSGESNEEKTIALHTLLLRDLMFGDYEGYLQDKLLSGHISPPVIGEEFADVNLSIFDWKGDDAEQGYFCASLDTTVQALAKNKTDAHALNCLGEFFRTTRLSISTEKEDGGSEVLSGAVSTDEMGGIPNRLAYYQQVINDPKAEPEDKTYALYRGVMCYAPSGSNDCGGKGVEPEMRKGWFTKLKEKYQGNQWAERLNYYW